MPETSYIEILETLRMANCPTCGTMHAVPAALFLAARQHQTPLFCPTGHQWTPADANPALNPLQSLAESYSALAGVRAENAALRRRVDELTPAGVLSPLEFQRRSRVLAERAEKTGQGRVICPFCGRQKAQNSLAEHMRRSHADALSQTSAADFAIATRGGE